MYEYLNTEREQREIIIEKENDLYQRETWDTGKERQVDDNESSSIQG